MSPVWNRSTLAGGSGTARCESDASAVITTPIVATESQFRPDQTRAVRLGLNCFSCYYSWKVFRRGMIVCTYSPEATGEPYVRRIHRWVRSSSRRRIRYRESGDVRTASEGGVIVGVGRNDSPTIIGGISDDASISCEEVFGPLRTVYQFSSTKEVLRRANDSRFVPYFAVWTQDLDRAQIAANRLKAATVAINQSPMRFP